MQVFNKLKRAISVLMLTLVLFTVSTQNSVALGAYSQSSYDTNTTDQQLQEAAFPAVVVGVLLVGAFAYGVYEGWNERAAGGHIQDTAMLESYQSNDFSQFDSPTAAVL